jgi:MFS family permease
MRNLWILATAQAFGACGMIILVTFGGIVGARIAPTPALATLPLSLTIVGIALSTLPAALVMRRFGRKPAFIGSALLGSAAALLVAWATANEDFVLFCAASVIIGINQAFVLQYRFAATEYVASESAGRAVGMVMLGILVAAVLGPELGDRARLLGGWPEFTGSYVVLSALYLLGALTLAWLGAPLAQATRATAAERPLREMAAQPTFIVAVLAAVISFAAMSFIMTATPISMHVHDDMSVAQTKQVISAHLIAMYAPSLVSGWLTRVVGLKAMMLGGITLMAACIAIAALVGHEFVHYLSGLVLLGLGWNLLFVSGTTLLTRTYTAAERFKAQGFNDMATFGAQAVVSLLAGTAIQALGWAGLNLVALPLLGIMTAAVLWLHARERLAQVAPAGQT